MPSHFLAEGDSTDFGYRMAPLLPGASDPHAGRTTACMGAHASCRCTATAPQPPLQAGTSKKGDGKARRHQARAHKSRQVRHAGEADRFSRPHGRSAAHTTAQASARRLNRQSPPWERNTSRGPEPAHNGKPAQQLPSSATTPLHARKNR
jgi:hypothetical protein